MGDLRKHIDEEEREKQRQHYFEVYKKSLENDVEYLVRQVSNQEVSVGDATSIIVGYILKKSKINLESN